MKLIILGSGQDVGIPHIGCYCEVCEIARKDVKFRRFGPSVAVINAEKPAAYMFDASPDIKYQFDMIHDIMPVDWAAGQKPVEGIFLTHAHIGHYEGLMQLGKEGMDIRNLLVYCTPKMKEFLRENFPFSYLVARKNIDIREIRPEETFTFDGFEVRAFGVPHRNEIADTFAFEIVANKKVIYLPDIDDWNEDSLRRIKEADIALIDGTFYREEELTRFAAVPHPPIREAIKKLEGLKTEIYFTHINHTNPINRDSEEKQLILDKGFKITHDGLTLDF